MTAILECSNCGFHAVFEQEDNLGECPKCSDSHVDVTYGVASYVSFHGPMLEGDGCAYCGTTTEKHSIECEQDGGGHV